MKFYRVWYCASSFIESGDYDLPLKDQPFVRSGVFEAENANEVMAKIPETNYIIDCEILETV
jgi:hypothetical protein